MVDLLEGVYERVISEALETALSGYDSGEFLIEKKTIELADSETVLSHYMQDILKYGLKLIKDRKDQNGNAVGLKGEIEACNALLEKLQELTDDEDICKWKIGQNGEELLSFWNKTVNKSKLKVRPISSLAISSIFTGSKKDPTLALELKNEIETSDSIDLLVSFIKHSGLVLIKESLKNFAESGKRIRIITTTYMGATDPTAIEYLKSLPKVEIKISYDTRTTRLHAKSYIFHRENGFSTAFVGSSNLSGAAITEGMEWNLKITQRDMPQVIESINAAFDSYWNSPDFEEYILERDKERLRKALKRENSRNVSELDIGLFNIEPYPFQKEILNDLEAERKLRGSNRNLVVAATGTGKTMIAAFDFKRFLSDNIGCRFLFAAHREEILRKSMSTFRVVLSDANFGELATGNNEPDSYNRVFMTIRTLESKNIIGQVPPDFYDYIVVDECHHGAAESYQNLLTYFKPKILLGLTATPERADNLDILKYFNNRIASEIRLHEAIDRELLVPFHYFGVTDNVDLSSIKFHRGAYDESELEELYLQNEARVKLIRDALFNYYPDVDSICGLGFCVSKKHAEFMSRKFNELGIRSEYLTGDSSLESRISVPGMLRRHEIKFIFTVDLYNEGVDIPEINVELMLRPTKSLTIFIQQLGRGLRTCDGKSVLTVLDFVGQSNAKYDLYEKKLMYMSQTTGKQMRGQLETGFSSVPLGCFIEMEKVAKEYVLNHIKRYTNNKLRLRQLLQDYHQETGKFDLKGFLAYDQMIPDDIYSRESTFTGLLSMTGILPRSEIEGETDEKMSRILRRIADINGYKWITTLKKMLESNDFDESSEEHVMMATMLYYTFYERDSSYTQVESLSAFIQSLRTSPYRYEISELLDYNLEKINYVSEEMDLGYYTPLELHCSYTKAQIMAALGMSTFEKAGTLREGVFDIKSKKTHIFLIDLKKADKDYSPTTMYKDYAMNDELFHWESQNKTSQLSSVGQSYINHEKNGYQILLFVRETQKKNGKTQPFTYLGKGKFVSCEGNKPMSIVWKMEKAMPVWVVSESSAIRI